jgi:ATP-dependent DNA helicase RecG
MLTSSSNISEIAGIGPSYQKLLANLEIFTVGDLLNHLPARFEKFNTSKKINDLKPGEQVSFVGELFSIDNIRTRNGKRLTKGVIKDETGKIEATWFNQQYLSKALKFGVKYRFSGKVDIYGKKLNMIAPAFENYHEEDFELQNEGELIPIYPETKGISSKFISAKIKKALEEVIDEDFLPEEIIQKYKFLKFKENYSQIHFPNNAIENPKLIEKLSFEELFIELLKVEKRREHWNEKLNSFVVKDFDERIDSLEKSLPFPLTDTQKKAISEIIKDLQDEKPMNRLLEGDVGTGKTLVAVFASFLIAENGYQTLYIAPTEILAKQHFETFKKYLEPLGIKVVLKTASSKVNLDETEFDICIGTHAILFNYENLNKIALVIVDEQHRFGVEQRSKILNIYNHQVTPNLLTMTATPIPRTLALTIYGDLDISILEAPPNKDKKITTYVVPPTKRDEMYKWILDKNEPTFIVCPFINESEAEDFEHIKSAIKEYEVLSQGIFKNKKVGLLHGKLKPQEKEEVLTTFRNGDIEILVSTPVIEVGVDIPDASIIVIESAERYGLASLHQLRGRVGRGKKEGFCVVIPSTFSKPSFERLKNLEITSNGLKLAELDLKNRGEGDITGRMQSGVKNFKFTDLSNLHLIERAKQEAAKYANTLEKYPKLNNKLKTKELVWRN